MTSFLLLRERDTIASGTYFHDVKSKYDHTIGSPQSFDKNLDHFYTCLFATILLPSKKPKWEKTGFDAQS